MSRWRLFVGAQEYGLPIAPVPLFHAILFALALTFIAAVIAEAL
jgi:hypothetical protein